MKELLIIRNTCDDLGIGRDDLLTFFETIQRSRFTRFVGWRLQNGQVNLPEVPLPPPEELVSFYTVNQEGLEPQVALRDHIVGLKNRPYAHSMLVQWPFAAWRYAPMMIARRYARIFGVAPSQIMLKFIETNRRLLIHSDAFYGKPKGRGSYDPNDGPPGYESMHESNMLEASVNWTLKGHEVPINVRGKKKFVNNEGALELPVAFNPKELHGTQIDADRLTFCVRPKGLTYQQVRECLQQNNLIQEIRT